MAQKKILGTVAAVFWLFSLAGPLAAREGEREARLTETRGEVTLYTAEEPEGAPAEKDMPLETGDRIRTGEDSSAEVSLDGQHVVSLRENTDFTLSAARAAETELKIALGSLLAKIGALFGSESLRVRTPTAVAAVRGTEFGVEVPSDREETTVGVFDEGKLEVSGEAGAPEILIANQETLVARGARPLPAYQLKRLVRHRAFMRGLRRRAQSLRRAWRALPPEERRELRQRLIERMKSRRRELLERREKGQERPRERRRLRPDQEKMERRREEIRRKRRSP